MASFTLLRSIVTQTAEGTAKPGTNLFQSIPGLGRRLEIAWGTVTFAGTVAGSSAKVSLWRLVDGTRVDKVAEFVLVNGVIPLAQIVEHLGGTLWVTVESFVGGTNPNLSVDISVREAY